MAVIPSLRVNGVPVELTASTDVIIGTADTSGVRLDVSAGTLRVREGDNSANAPLSALSIALGANGTPFVEDAANVIAQRSADSPQALRVYRDSTSGRRIDIDASSGGASYGRIISNWSSGSYALRLGAGTEHYEISTGGNLVGLTATGGVGYGTGAGGTVTQLTSKSTGVTLNTVTGEITLNGAALAADTSVSFTLTNSAIAAADLVVVTHHSAGTAGAYTVTGQAAAGSATITVRNVTAGSLSEAIVLKFAVIKGATS